MIVIIPEMTVRQLMVDIVNATHGLADHTGEAFVAGTIDPKQLRQAAICAIMIATGRTMVPLDDIPVKRTRTNLGIFREE